MKTIIATLGITALFMFQPLRQEDTKPAAPATTPQSQQQPVAKPAAQEEHHHKEGSVAPVVLPAEFKDAKKMAMPAEQVFKNVVFFKGKPASELRDAMLAMKDMTAHDCVACHDANNWADNKKEHHKIGGQMLQIVELANTTLYPKNPTKVTCWTCHRGKDQPDKLARVQTPPELVAYNNFVQLTPEQAEKPAVQVFLNLKLVPTDLPAKSIANLMVLFSRSLGVNCSHCHDTGAFDSDQKGEKETARRMYAMILKSKDTIYAKERANRMRCDGCHHGTVEPVETPKEMREAAAKALKAGS